MPCFGHPSWDEEKPHMLKCSYVDCVAGMGLAGSGRCFLFGIWWHNACPMYENEDELIARMEGETL